MRGRPPRRACSAERSRRRNPDGRSFTATGSAPRDARDLLDADPARCPAELPVPRIANPPPDVPRNTTNGPPPCPITPASARSDGRPLTVTDRLGARRAVSPGDDLPAVPRSAAQHPGRPAHDPTPHHRSAEHPRRRHLTNTRSRSPTDLAHAVQSHPATTCPLFRGAQPNTPAAPHTTRHPTTAPRNTHAGATRRTPVTANPPPAHAAA